MAVANDFNTQIIEEFRANAGKVGGMFEGTDLLLLTTIGAKTGRQTTAPLAWYAEGDRLHVFGSKAGADTHPAWYHNLIANPDVTVEAGAETYQATATVLKGAERDRVWEIQVARAPGFGEYQQNTDRIIPVIALDLKAG
jgi:deazaflavin-dependent oxidoreductase (nitroreductase family)